MKTILLAIALFVAGFANAATYYVATTGSDSNPGTLAQPWRTIEHNLSPGDIMYVRGGTYTSTKANTASVHFMLQNLSGTAANPIKIWAYPGEQPIFSMSNITPSSYANPIGLYVVNCSYVHVKGIHVTYLKQIADGSGISHGITLWNSQHCTMELIEVDNIGGPGFTIESGSNDNYILNCDSHHNGDGLSGSQWDASDGFDISTGGDFSTRNVLEGCRSWLNCDDGYDTFNSNALVTFKNCWAFWNGVKPWGPSNTQVTPSAMTTNNYSTWHGNSSYVSSSGEGFKLGPANTQNFSLLTRIVTNCVSFENRGTGYASNSLSSLTAKHQLYNNIAYKNDNDGFSYGAGWSAGATQSFRNNWAWSNNQAMSGANFVYDGNNSTAISNNYWDNYYGSVNYGNLKANIGQLSNSDFLSVSSVGVDGPRQADGSLPNLNFLKLATTSKLVNVGVNVGLTYSSTAPDLGAFESNGTASNVIPTANAGSDIIVTLPTNSASLNGSGTDPDGSITAYSWTKVSGPTGGTITNSTSATSNVTGLVAGIYIYQLTVTDNKGATSTDNLQITVNPAATNTAPTANAGVDKTVTLPASTVSLAGSGTDVGGSVTAYAWSKVSGPAGGTIASPTAATTNITALVQGTYQFQLKVTDNGGLTGTDLVQVTVSAAGNTAPTANAGADKTITLPTNSVSLAGSGTDANGTISAYAWTKVSGPTGGAIATATAATTSVTALVQGTYKFELKVTDNGGSTGKDTVQVIVNAASSGPNNAYGGVRWAIPGTVEAENFDIGGQNVAYYDNTPGNNGASYRTSDYVDITASSEGGNLVGWIVAGEWMKYSVNVTTAGSYTITARVACPTAGKSFNIEMDGIKVTTVTVPNTGGSQTWQTVTIKNVNLTAGNKTMRIYAANGSGFNINYVTFTGTSTARIAADGTEADADVNTTVTAFPLPFATSFSVNLYGSVKGEYSLTLVDISGKPVWQKKVNKSGETLTENIYMGNLASGVYILQVVSPEQKVSTQKIIKN